MKSHFSRAVALTFVVCGSLPMWAQPNVAAPEVVAPPAQPKGADFDKAETSADALALIGMFYNKMTRAGSYRGRLVMVTTIVEKGRFISKRTTEGESSWIADKEIQGAIKKDVTDFVFTTTSNHKTTTEKFRIVYDGAKNYRFNQTKKIWSESVQEEGETSGILDATDAAWTFALANFRAGREYEIEEQTVDGQNQVVVQGQPEDEYVFDAMTGNLLSWNRTFFVNGAKDSTIKTECRWLQHEFDVPLADTVFGWKTPTDATKVAPEKLDFETFLVQP